MIDKLTKAQEKYPTDKYDYTLVAFGANENLYAYFIDNADKILQDKYILELFKKSQFMFYFTQKGRFESYLKTMPIFLVLKKELNCQQKYPKIQRKVGNFLKREYFFVKLNDIILQLIEWKI